MRDIRIGSVIFHSRIGKISDNLDRIVALIKAAKQQDVEIIIFPEMNLTGYDISENIRETALSITDEVVNILQELSDKEKIVILAGMAEKAETYKNIYASHLVIRPNMPVGVYRKLHIAPPEKNIFSAGDRIPVFEAFGIKFGIQLCYDAHFPELSTAMALKGAEIIFIPHASPRGTPEDKLKSWMRHLPARAYDNSVFVIACNACGDNENGLKFPGISAAFDPSGHIISELFADKDEMMISDLKASDMEKVRGHRMRFFLPNRRADIYLNNIYKEN